LDEPVIQNPAKPRKNPHFEKILDHLKIAGNHKKTKFRNLSVTQENREFFFWMSPSFKIPRNRRKIQVLRIFESPKNHGKPRKKSNVRNPVHRGKTAENPNFETCSLFLAKKFPTGESSHLPLISLHICLQKETTTN
jgi:hypothetical protein